MLASMARGRGLAGVLLSARTTALLAAARPHSALRAEALSGTVMTVEDRVEDEIAKNRGVLMYSKTTCPYCAAAKTMLAGSPLSLTVHELDTMSSGGAVQDQLLAVTGQRTVPNIFIGQKHIGGYTDIERALQDGSFAEAIKDCDLFEGGLPTKPPQ